MMSKGRDTFATLHPRHGVALNPRNRWCQRLRHVARQCLNPARQWGGSIGTPLSRCVAEEEKNPQPLTGAEGRIVDNRKKGEEMEMKNGTTEVRTVWIVPNDVKNRIVSEWWGSIGPGPDGITHAYIDEWLADDGSPTLRLPKGDLRDRFYWCETHDQPSEAWRGSCLTVDAGALPMDCKIVSQPVGKEEK